MAGSHCALLLLVLPVPCLLLHCVDSQLLAFPKDDVVCVNLQVHVLPRTMADGTYGVGQVTAADTASKQSWLTCRCRQAAVPSSTACICCCTSLRQHCRHQQKTVSGQVAPLPERTREGLLTRTHLQSSFLPRSGTLHH
jgi:hypothetical protein